MASTHLKNISQVGNLPQIGVKIKNIWNHHPEIPLYSKYVPKIGKVLMVWLVDWHPIQSISNPHIFAPKSQGTSHRFSNKQVVSSYKNAVIQMIKKRKFQEFEQQTRHSSQSMSSTISSYWIPTDLRWTCRLRWLCFQNLVMPPIIVSLIMRPPWMITFSIGEYL